MTKIKKGFIVFNKKTGDLFFAPDKHILKGFLNDELRNPKNYDIKKVKELEVELYPTIFSHQLEYIADSVMTPMEQEVFYNFPDEDHMLDSSALDILEDMNVLKFSESEEMFIRTTFEKYLYFISSGIDNYYENFFNEYELGRRIIKEVEEIYENEKQT